MTNRSWLALAALVAPLMLPSVARACETGAGRSGYAMAYDAGSKRVVIFGGETADGKLSSDLLAWDGTRWSCISDGGPGARSDAALAFDAKRNVLVLYGGRMGRTELRDTWELSGTTWTRRDSAGPTPEPHGVMAYDSRSGVTLLFSGLGDDTPARRTWSWDGRAWSKVAGEPNAQFPNAMFDGPTGAQLMTALRVGSDRYNPVLHQWRGEGMWIATALNGEAPVFSPQAPAAFMPAGAVLYAGFESNQSVTTWFIDRGAWKKFEGASPPRRKGAHMVYDAARRVAVLHGGDDGNRVLSDTWEWDGTRWRQIP